MFKSSSQLAYFPSAQPLIKPLNVKAELNVATAAVANATKFFSLVTNFSCFSLIYFFWRLNLKT